EVAAKLNIDRTFISRLEKMGEIRKGNSIAVIAFPVLNKDQLLQLLKKHGIDYHLVMTETERWNFVKNRSGIELLNEITDILAKLKDFDAIIMIGSNQRVKIFEALFSQKVIGIEIGESPIEEDRNVNLVKLEEIINSIQV
ncbi:MAG: transcriptional regulator, partial [Bacillota bacterium]|nr:transcriptional regulator [Bacillota bacterium]